MSHSGEAYLILVIVAFLTFVGTLFGAMLKSHDRPDGHRNERSG